MAASETWRTVSADIIMAGAPASIFPDRNFPLAEGPSCILDD
jgi:hypothetical protein